MIMLMQIWLRMEQSLWVVDGGTVPPDSGWWDVQLVSADRRGGGTSVQPGSGWQNVCQGSDIG